MKQDNITEIHIYVKYEIVYAQAIFQSQSLYKNWPKSKKKKNKKNKTKIGICTKTVCHFDDGFCHTQ